LAEKLYASASKRIETSRLNQFLAGVTDAHPPRLKSGARVKIRYMTQKGILPPTFVLFKTSRGLLEPAYERYFVRALREAFGFEGTPVRLVIRSN